jgi:hypothetical protein
MAKTNSSSDKIWNSLIVPLEYLEFVVLFGARKRENTKLVQIEKIRGIHVGSAEDHDLGCLHAGITPESALGIGIPCGI